MHGPSALVLVNATAARIKRRSSLVTRIGELALAAGAELRVTASTDDLDAACAALAKRDRLPHVILVGGDGSHMAGVSTIARALGERDLPTFALCGGGTVNTTAAAWGSTGDPIVDVTRALAGAPSEARETLSVEDHHGKRRLGFIWGTGLVARFFELYDQAGGGIVTAAKLTARLATSAAIGGELAAHVLGLMPCSITVDGAPVPGDSFSLAVSSVLEDVGLGIRVTYRAGSRPSHVHFVASRGKPAQLASLLPRALLGKPFNRPGDLDALAREIIIEHPASFPYVLDGDTLRSTRVRLTSGPLLQVSNLSAR